MLLYPSLQYTAIPDGSLSLRYDSLIRLLARAKHVDGHHPHHPSRVTPQRTTLRPRQQHPPLTDEAHDGRPCAQHALAYTLSSLTKPNHHAPPLSPTYKAHQSAHKGTIRFNDLSPISCLRAGREKKDTACRRGGEQFNARPARPRARRSFSRAGQRLQRHRRPEQWREGL